MLLYVICLQLPLPPLKYFGPVLIPFCWKHCLQAELKLSRESITCTKHTGSHKIWQQVSPSSQSSCLSSNETQNACQQSSRYNALRYQLNVLVALKSFLYP